MDFCTRWIESDPGIYALLAGVDWRVAMAIYAHAAARTNLHAAMVPIQRLSFCFLGASNDHSFKRPLSEAPSKATSTSLQTR